MLGQRSLLTIAAAAALGLLLASCIGAEDEVRTGDPSDFVFDDTVIRTYELIVDPGDWRSINDDPRLEQYVPATLRFEGKIYQQVAVRYKGFYGALRMCFDLQGNLLCKKLSMKLKFSEYDDSARFYGLKRLNFHSMEGDPTKMHDILAYGLFREAGVAAPRATYAKLIVNGEYLGLFALVEQIDGQFTRSNFPDGGKGNLYKEVWPVHSSPGPYLRALKTNREEDPNVEKMVRFATEVGEATDDTLLSVLESWTDMDVLANYLAVDRLIENWDGIFAWYCAPSTCFNHNYYWYEETGRNRVWLIPWDVDHTFEIPGPIRTFYNMPDWDEVPESCDTIPVFRGIPGRPPGCDEFTRRLAAATWDQYSEATRSLLDGPFQTTALRDRIDELTDHIADEVAADPNGPTYEAWQSAVEELKSDVVEMRAYIEGKIGT